MGKQSVDTLVAEMAAHLGLTPNQVREAAVFAAMKLIAGTAVQSIVDAPRKEAQIPPIYFDALLSYETQVGDKDRLLIPAAHAKKFPKSADGTIICYLFERQGPEILRVYPSSINDLPSNDLFSRRIDKQNRLNVKPYLRQGDKVIIRGGRYPYLSICI